MPINQSENEKIIQYAHIFDLLIIVNIGLYLSIEYQLEYVYI